MKTKNLTDLLFLGQEIGVELKNLHTAVHQYYELNGGVSNLDARNDPFHPILIVDRVTSRLEWLLFECERKPYHPEA